MARYGAQDILSRSQLLYVDPPRVDLGASQPSRYRHEVVNL